MKSDDIDTGGAKCAKEAAPNMPRADDEDTLTHCVTALSAA
jgi:hypothetical protein